MIEQKIIEQLKQGEYILPLEDKDYRQKAKLLVVFATNNLLDIFYDHDNYAYKYTLKNGASLDDFLADNKLEDMDEKYAHLFDEVSVYEEIGNTMNEVGYYTLSAIPDSDNWPALLDALIHLHNEEMITINFCPEHMSYTFKPMDDFNEDSNDIVYKYTKIH